MKKGNKVEIVGWAPTNYGGGELQLFYEIRKIELQKSKTDPNSPEIVVLNAELEKLQQQANEIWEIQSWDDFPNDCKYAGTNKQAKAKSWFLIQNINFFGRIGGFDTIVQRIGHAQCPLSLQGMVNMLRPVAQVTF